MRRTASTRWHPGAAGLDVLDVDVARLVDAHLAYLEMIGAAGQQDSEPDVPACAPIAGARQRSA